MPDLQSPPTTPWDLAKLYMQQFGNLTFGTVTLLLLWQFMVKPELEEKKEAQKAQAAIIESLHKLVESLQVSVLHMEKTVEMQDRNILREQTK